MFFIGDIVRINKASMAIHHIGATAKVVETYDDNTVKIKIQNAGLGMWPIESLELETDPDRLAYYNNRDQ